MKELFQYVLDNYLDGERKVDSTTELYDCLVHQLPSALRSVIRRDDLIIKGSMGQGNKSEYPWVSILNKNITRTTQSGLYIVYLFKKDMSGFYVTLNQGITNFENLYGRKKYDYAVKVSNYFKNEIDGTTFSKKGILLGDGRTRDLGYGYERTTVLSKYYPSHKYTYEMIKTDLDELIRVYDFMAQHMETSSYDKIIKDVIAEEDNNYIINGDNAIQIIKEAVDPDDELPFGFSRELKEQRPYVDRTNKFRRITNPRVSKIDYLKKAYKDIKNGLLGEELVIEHEKKRLSERGREDLAEKVVWISQESDSYGYDIESFEIDDKGREKKIYIEVKTTSSRVDTEFYISKHEVETSEKKKEQYYIYRVYDVNAQNPKFYRANGEVEKNFILDPVTYMARYKYPVVLTH